MRTATIAGAVDRPPLPAADFAALLPDVARRLFGEPPRIEASGATWRYRTHGSLAVHVGGAHAGTWRDHQAGAGGGVLALIEHEVQTDKAGALAWLVDARLIAPPAGADARPAAPARPAAARVSAPGSPPESSVRRPDGAGAAPTAAVAAAILAAAVPADDTPARAYLAARGTWPANGPPLPAAVRWLPPGVWEHLPTWPGPDGRPRRLMPPADGIRSLRPDAPPVPRCGALVFALARPGCAPDAVTLEAVTAAGARPAERWRRTVGAAAGRILEVAAPPGDGWPDAGAAPLVVALVEGEADALALARLRLPGVLVRAAGGTAGVRRGAALVADLPATVAAALVSDGDRPGRAAVAKLHATLQNAGRTCYAAVLRGGDLDAVLRGAIDVDLAERHAERAGILEHDDGLPRPAATARALARMIERLPTPEGA